MEDLCTACLCSGRNLYSIRETGFKHLYLQILNEMKVCDTPELSIRVCWECRSLLRRLQLFKQQVKRSYNELMEYAQNSTKIPQPAVPRLQISHVHNYVYPEIDIKMELDDTQFLDYEIEFRPDETHCEPETFVNDLDVEPRRRRETRKSDKVSYAKRPNSGQLECLVGFLEINPNIARGLLRTYTGKVETKRKWDKIATRLNSLGGVKKDGRGWAKYWAEKKFAIKKQLAQLSDATTPTGGIPDDLPALDKRFLAVMSGQCGQTGEPSPAVNPLPEQATPELVVTPEVILSEKNPVINESLPSTSNIDQEKCENTHLSSASTSPRPSGKPIFRSVNKKKFRMDPNMATFTAIEEKRVQAELMTPIKEKAKKKIKQAKKTPVKKRIKVKKKKPVPLEVLEDNINADVTDVGDIEKKIEGEKEKVADKDVSYKETTRANGTVKAEKEVLPERPQCAECGKHFSSRKTYKYHLNVLHKGQNRYPCPRCGKVYQWKSNLGRHLRSHKARDSGELYCETCDKRFASVATYRQHLRVSRRHVPESDFSFMCNECGKKFVNKTRLRDHIDWEHLKKIKFRCQLCNKPFKCHTSLYVHMQNVHRNKEKKDNLCHVCGKSYQNAAKLKYHIVAMHTSETPYQCSQCNAAFGWYSSLYRHVREVHYKMKVQPKKSKKSKKSEVLPSLLPPQVVLAQMNQAGPP